MKAANAAAVIIPIAETQVGKISSTFFQLITPFLIARIAVTGVTNGMAKIRHVLKITTPIEVSANQASLGISLKASR